METREIAKLIGGIAVGKLEDIYIPTKYAIPGTSIDGVRLGLGIVQLGLAVTQEKKVIGTTKDILDVLGVAGAQLIVNELAKLAPTAPAAPTAIPAAIPTAAPTAVSAAPTVAFY
jgi:hypothetical protein